MALNTIPAVAGLTRNIQSFTSSTTWTVPSTAQYVDVLVVGGGSGGRGGKRQNDNSDFGGFGGAITVLNNIYLGGTGTVSITIGSGTNGTTGTSTTSRATIPGDAGYSAFGTYVYSQGGQPSTGSPGYPGYKGTTANPNLSNDTTQSNYAPTLIAPYAVYSNYTGSQYTGNLNPGIGVNAFGITGGWSGAYFTTNTSVNTLGGVPGWADPTSAANSLRLSTVPSFDFYNLKSTPLIGTATAGTTGGAGGTAGPAGVVGVGGGGGTAFYGTGQHGQGGPGAGGGGGQGGLQLGGSGTGGNGGNAGTNTGAGGGGGGNTGGTGGGTGGNGGNGAAGIIIVTWLG